jgi:hypothetical protein
MLVGGETNFSFRLTLTSLNSECIMMGKLHLDLFCQDKYLLNHVDLKIKLRRSRDAFALVADATNYKIKIKEMALYVRKVQLSPAVRMGMNLHSQVALFYELKGSNFRHVGCEIKSKQGVSFGVIFSRNGISLNLTTSLKLIETDKSCLSTVLR